MTKNTSDEDDLVQEVFFKAWRHLGSFRSEAEFRTWIIRIAINEVMQLYRRKSHDPLSRQSEDQAGVYSERRGRTISDTPITLEIDLLTRVA